MAEFNKYKEYSIRRMGQSFPCGFYVTLKNNTSDRTIMIDVKEKVFSCIANGIVRMLSNAELFIMKQVKNGDGIF